MGTVRSINGPKILRSDKENGQKLLSSLCDNLASPSPFLKDYDDDAVAGYGAGGPIIPTSRLAEVTQ